MIYYKPFKKIPVLIDENIDVNKELAKTINDDYNNNIESDRSLRVKPASAIKATWYPEKIIFENGRLPNSYHTS